jgi:hypothetical protein
VWGVESDGGVALWGGAATDLLGRVAGGVSTDGQGLAAAATTPLGYADFDTSANYHIIPADPADVVGNLGNDGDSVAGTVTHMASTGALSLSDGIENGGDVLANALGSTPAGPLVGGVESATDMASEDIQDGAGLMAEQAGNLPSSDDLPTTLPAVPDLPEVPGLGGLPVQVPELGDLPVSLPELPVAAPDTSAVTDVLQNNPVSDAVSSSPVGGLADTARGAADSLPVGDLTDDLNLGL